MRLRFYNAVIQLAILGLSVLLGPSVWLCACVWLGQSNWSGRASAEEPAAQGKPLPWKVLAPEDGKPFTDPYSKLTDTQLRDLSYILRVRQLIATHKIAADGRDAAEADSLAARLKDQGVDIGWLAAQRDRVRQIRTLQVESVARSVAESLQDKNVSLVGYVIPLKTDQGKLKDFLLVPTFAACSHEDPPPSLKVVQVSTRSGILPPKKRHPVRVTGKLVAKARTSEVVNGSGSIALRSAYSITRPTINIAPLPEGSPPTR